MVRLATLSGKQATSGVVMPVFGSKVGSLQDTPVIENLEMRRAILKVESKLTQVEGAKVGKTTESIMPTIHHFAPGIYGREIYLPKGSRVIGKLHRHSHLNILAHGRVKVATEDGIEELASPCIWTSNAGTKRVVIALEDSIWICVHPTETTDLDKIEAATIAPNYQALEV